MFGFCCEGLGSCEDYVFSHCVVDAYAPRFHVIENTVIAPGVGCTAEESSSVGVDVFNPGIPCAAGFTVGTAISQFANPYFGIIGHVITDFFIVSKCIPFTEIQAGISSPEVIGFKAFGAATEIIVLYANSRTSCAATTKEAF